MKWMSLAILAGVGVGLAGANAAHAQSQAPRPTREAVMEIACAAVDAAACRAKAETALAQGQSFQLVILQGCLVEFSQFASHGPEEVDAAKERANRCLAAAVRDGTRMSQAELLAGQATLRKRPAFKGRTDAEVAETLRAGLVQADAECGRIQHKYTRYNCYSRRLAALAPSGP